MPIAVGMIETKGFPAVVEAADAMGEGGSRHPSWLRENWQRPGSR